MFLSTSPIGLSELIELLFHSSYDDPRSRFQNLTKSVKPFFLLLSIYFSSRTKTTFYPHSSCMQIAQTIGRAGSLVDWLLWYICTVTDCTTVVLFRVDNPSSYSSMRPKHHHHRYL